MMTSKIPTQRHSLASYNV